MMHLPKAVQPERGFTLVETLVAITILMIAIVGPYYSIQQAITASMAARDQLIASQLAQEAEEYIYFVRDTNYLSGSSWLTGLSPACTGTYGCVVDSYQNTKTACTASGCPALMLNASNQYTQTGSFPVTRFTRTVKIQTMSATEVQVTVSVTWVTQHRNYTINSVESLYNWL